MFPRSVVLGIYLGGSVKKGVVRGRVHPPNCRTTSCFAGFVGVEARKLKLTTPRLAAHFGHPMWGRRRPLRLASSTSSVRSCRSSSLLPCSSCSMADTSAIRIKISSEESCAVRGGEANSIISFWCGISDKKEITEKIHGTGSHGPQGTYKSSIMQQI